MNENQELVVVFHAKPWNLTDEKTGEMKAGIKVCFLPLGQAVAKADEVGTPAFSESLSEGNWEELKRNIPGVFRIENRMVMRGGKRGLAMVGLQPVKAAFDLATLSAVKVS